MSQIVRSFRPVVDMEKCNKCSLCQIYCPEGTVVVVNKEETVFDYRYCKGCGVCAVECPTGAIEMEKEV